MRDSAGLSPDFAGLNVTPAEPGRHERKPFRFALSILTVHSDNRLFGPAGPAGQAVIRLARRARLA